MGIIFNYVTAWIDEGLNEINYSSLCVHSHRLYDLKIDKVTVAVCRGVPRDACTTMPTTDPTSR